MSENKWSFILGIRELIEMYLKCVSEGPKSQTADKLQHRQSDGELWYTIYTLHVQCNLLSKHLSEAILLLMDILHSVPSSCMLCQPVLVVSLISTDLVCLSRYSLSKLDCTDKQNVHICTVHNVDF